MKVVDVPVIADDGVPDGSFELRDSETGERLVRWDPPRFEHENHTVWLFGKPYYWALADGTYRLLRGTSPYDEVTLKDGEWHSVRGTVDADGNTHIEIEKART